LGRINPLPYREIKRRLETAGFTEHSQKGSHVKFVRSHDLVTDTVIVPKKPVGTLRSILSQAHIHPDDWGASRLRGAADERHVTARLSFRGRRLKGSTIMNLFSLDQQQ
jgi:predicted RNA binding protein YcfA (HicA-like mRNA interferase family)